MINLQSTNRSPRHSEVCAQLFSNGRKMVFDLFPNAMCFGFALFAVLFHNGVICLRTLNLCCLRKLTSGFKQPVQQQTDQRFQKPVSTAN